ncbi:MAG: PAS domain S-box protein, partial [Opitutales bacterium]
MKILIVEDDAATRTPLRETLEKAGYTICEAATGPEAINLLNGTDVDGVIARLHRPDFDAHLFCRQIRTHPHLRHLPLILYSTVEITAGYELFARDCDADQFVPPPAQPADILTALRRALGHVILRDGGESLYRQVFDCSNDALFLVGMCPRGHPGPILDVNDVACQLLGYSRDELLARSVRELEPPDIQPPFAALAEHFRPYQRFVFERCFLAKGGHCISVEISVRLFQSAVGSLGIAAARDITARKLAEAA